MLGKSRRFFDAGYKVPKYQLPIGGETLFSQSVRSFERYFYIEHFLFLVRNDNNDRDFVIEEIKRLKIKDFRVIQYFHEARGQAESVALACADYKSETPLIIFNIDTIRYEFQMPPDQDCGEGFLEVFKGFGYSWSFIEPGANNSVLRTAEKLRISDLCSNGLYFFKNIALYLKAYKSYVKSGQTVNGEIYVAPLYNELIKYGHDIRFILVDKKLIDHCGVPKDYEVVKLKMDYF